MQFHVWILLLYLPVAVAGRECHADQNGTRFVLDSTDSCTGYQWRIKETVVANENQSNTSIVRTWGKESITFFNCQEHVTYKTECHGSPINCFYSCPAEMKRSTKSPAKGRPPLNLGAVIGGSKAVAIVLCIAVLILA